MRDSKGRFIKGSTERLGAKLSDEQKERLSVAHLGQEAWNKGRKGTHLSPDSEFKKGHKTWNKGLTKETDSRIAEYAPKCGEHNKQRTGDKHPRWKGGVSLYPPEFNSELKYEVRKRYDFVCALCHEHKPLAVHHWDKNRNNNHIMNLTPFCQQCHNKIHFHWKFDFTEDTQRIMKEYDLALAGGNK